MGTNTPHYNLYKPDEGETGWASAVNANWDTIDANLTNSLPRAYLAGLVTARNGVSPSTQIDIAAGQAQDIGNAGAMTLSATLTKDISTAWAVGSGNGGLGTSVTRTTNTWYHIFLIKRTDTNVVDAYFDTSAVAANIPSPYTLFRRVASVRTNATGSGNLTPYVQTGDLFTWADLPLDVDTTNPGTSAVAAALTVPSGVQVRAIMNVIFISGTDVTVDYLNIADPNTTDAAPSLTASPLANFAANNAFNGVGQIVAQTNTSRQIRYRCNVSDANVIVRIATVGWYDRRGRDD